MYYIIKNPGDPFQHCTLVYLPTYGRAIKGLFGPEEETWIAEYLAENPEAGAILSGAGGVRKLRVPLEGRGKRGGGRVLYYYRPAKGRIYMITAYAKNRRDDITSAECNAMKKLTMQLEELP